MDTPTRRSHCAGCAVCARIAAALPALAGRLGRGPTLAEINEEIGSPYKGFGGLGWHIARLVDEGYIGRRAGQRFYGLHLVRPLGTAT